MIDSTLTYVDGTPLLQVTPNTTVQKVAVRKNSSGGDIGTRRRINFIEGTNITLTIADDAGNDELDITIDAAGGGGGGSGDVVGPASATDNAVTRFDTGTGKLIQNSNAILEDTGRLNLIDATQSQLVLSGWDSRTGVPEVSTFNGELQLGVFAASCGRIHYNGASLGHLLIDNTYDDDDADIRIRSRTSGTAVTLMTLQGDSRSAINALSAVGQFDIQTRDATTVGLRVLGNNSATVPLIEAYRGASVVFSVDHLGAVVAPEFNGVPLTDAGSPGSFLNEAGAYVTIPAAITCVFDGQGSALVVGSKVYLEVPFGMTITGWTILAEVSGSVVIDIWKDTYANFPPVVGDSIAGSEKPTLSSAQKNQDLTLTTWTTTTVNAGDTLIFNVDSATTVTKVTVVLRGVKT
jgi:hypothetical protein